MFMLDKFLKKKKPKKPEYELSLKSVSAQRFNEMIDYYTNELKSRLKEIEDLKTQNELLLKTSIKVSAKSDESKREIEKLKGEMSILRSK